MPRNHYLHVYVEDKTYASVESQWKTVGDEGREGKVASEGRETRSTKSDSKDSNYHAYKTKIDFCLWLWR